MQGRLIAGLMYCSEERLQKAIVILQERFGPVDLFSERYAFSFTDYYEDEMGKGLLKVFACFLDPIERERIADIRIETGKIEETLSINGKRTINIDPGYVTKDAVFVASFKDRAHKAYLGRGVFLDLQMVLGKRKPRFFEWTFADYREKPAVDFFYHAKGKALSGGA